MLHLWLSCHLTEVISEVEAAEPPWGQQPVLWIGRERRQLEEGLQLSQFPQPFPFGRDRLDHLWCIVWPLLFLHPPLDLLPVRVRKLLEQKGFLDEVANAVPGQQESDHSRLNAALIPSPL